MHKLNLLVVDDEIKHNLHLFMMFLDESDFDLDFADSKSDFLSKNIKFYDAVILDINLDLWKMSFYEALEKVGSDAPIVLVSTKFNQKGTVVRISEALRRNKQVSIVQTFDLSLLQNVDNDETCSADETKINVAEVYNSILTVSVKKKLVEKIAHDDDIHILHISDPQYGDPGTDEWSYFLENDISDFLKDNFPKIDFVAITGDVAFSGSREEYDIATCGLKKLMPRVIGMDMKSSIERLIVVPGNHDVDFRFSSVPDLKMSFTSGKVHALHDLTDDKTVTSEYGMIPFRRFAYELTNNHNWITASDLNWINDNFTHLGLRFVLFNSAENISCNSPTVPNVAPFFTERLSKTTFVEPNKYFTIAFSHHGPIDPDYPEGVEALEGDWPNLSNFLRQSKVRLWLHGHGHRRLTIPFPFGLVNSRDLGKLKKSVADTAETPYFLKKAEFVRVMAPTSHLGEDLCHEGEKKGFNVIKLSRDKARVRLVEVFHYDLTDNGPKESSCENVRFRM